MGQPFFPTDTQPCSAVVLAAPLRCLRAPYSARARQGGSHALQARQDWGSQWHKNPLQMTPLEGAVQAQEDLSSQSESFSMELRSGSSK